MVPEADLRFVFAHGSGRAGAENWPLQSTLHGETFFLTFPGYGADPSTATDIDAESLVQFGAEHRHLVGHGHRVADHAAANELIEEWASSHR